jgi:hypothetical protein
VPVSAPTIAAPGFGTPAAPTYDPSLAQPYSAPPVSGAYGYVLPVPPAPLAPAPKRTGLIVVSLVATLLLLTTGVMTTMYLQQKSTADSANAQVTSLNKQVGDQTTKIDNLNTQLNNSQHDLSDAQAATTEMTTEKTALADCLNAINAAGVALINSGGVKTSAVTAAENAANTKCDAAQKYMSPVRASH